MCWCGFNALRQDVLDRHRRLACPGVTVGVTKPARVTRAVTDEASVTRGVTHHACPDCGARHVVQQHESGAARQAAYRARQGQ